MFARKLRSTFRLWLALTLFHFGMTLQAASPIPSAFALIGELLTFPLTSSLSDPDIAAVQQIHRASFSLLFVNSALVALTIHLCCVVLASRLSPNSRFRKAVLGDFLADEDVQTALALSPFLRVGMICERMAREPLGVFVIFAFGHFLLFYFGLRVYHLVDVINGAPGRPDFFDRIMTFPITPLFTPVEYWRSNATLEPVVVATNSCLVAGALVGIGWGVRRWREGRPR